MLTEVIKTVLEHSFHDGYSKPGHPQSDGTEHRQCRDYTVEDNAPNPSSYSPWAAVN